MSKSYCGVGEVGLRFAHVVGDAAAADVRAGEAEVDRVFLGDDADALVAVDEDLVAREQRVELVDLALELLGEGLALVGPAGRQIADLAADARVAGGEARAGERLDQVVDFLALGEGVEEERHRAGVHRQRAHAEQVRGDARQLAAQHADDLAARRDGPAHELLDRERVGDVVGQRGEVIEPVRVGHELVVGHVLGDFFVAAMEVADVGHGLGDDLAVELEQDAQHAVGAGVGRPHVERQRLAERQIVGPWPAPPAARHASRYQVFLDRFRRHGRGRINGLTE